MSSEEITVSSAELEPSLPRCTVSSSTCACSGSRHQASQISARVVRLPHTVMKRPLQASSNPSVVPEK
jgi:hypothetical protein